MTRPTLHVFTPTGAFRPWAVVVMLIVCFGLALGLTIAYVKKVDQDSDRRNAQRARDICEVVVLLDDRWQRVPATTQDQRDFFDAWHRYRVRLGC